MRHLIQTRLLLLCVVCVSGCKLFHREPTPKYQTVPASPQRDTKTSIKEHEKALKLLEDRLGGPKMLAKAEEHLQKALVADVTYGPAHNSLGMLYFQQHQLYLAAWEFEYAARVMPGRVEPLNNLGLVLESGGKLDEAIDAYSQAFVIDSQNPHVLGNLARARLRKGDEFEQVRPLLEELVFYDSRPDWVGWAEEQLGLNPKATTEPQTPPPTAEPEELPPGVEGPGDLPLPLEAPPITFLR